MRIIAEKGKGMAQRIISSHAGYAAKSGFVNGFVDSPLLKDSKERRRAAAASLVRTYRFFREELFPKGFKRKAARRAAVKDN